MCFTIRILVIFWLAFDPDKVEIIYYCLYTRIFILLLDYKTDRSIEYRFIFNIEVHILVCS